MRKLLVAFVLFAAVALGLLWLKFVRPAPAELCHTKTEHLLKAAEHLEAAGLTDDANKIRQQAAKVPSAKAEIDWRHTSGIPNLQVLLKIRVLEISRTKLRKLGIDFDGMRSAPNAVFNNASRKNNKNPALPVVPHIASNNDAPDVVSKDNGDPRPHIASNEDASHMAFKGSSDFAFNALASTDPYLKVLDALVKGNLAKVIAEPTLVAINNQPGFFRSGGNIWDAVPQANRKMGDKKEIYGTMIDCTPTVFANRKIRLDCQIQLNELDWTNSTILAGKTIPGVQSMTVHTAIECKSGQTVVLGGLRQRRRVSSAPAMPTAASAMPNPAAPVALNSSAETAPKADDKPTAKEAVEEIETLVLLTPEIVEPLSPAEKAALPYAEAPKPQTRQ